MRLIPVVVVFFAILISAQVEAVELPAKAQRMLDDLGSPEVQQLNNGKKLRCLYGGTKTITVSFLEGATVFSGDYNYCRETGITRDGYTEVIVQDGEIVGQSSKRSLNGKLFDAVMAGETEKVRKLIKNKADVNYTESMRKTDDDEVRGWTPLMSAALHGNFEIVKLLVKAGAWVNCMNSHATNALWLAADNGNADIVSYLIAKRAYVNNRNKDDITPLMVASLGGRVEVVKALIAAKADLDLVHKDGDSALMIAVANGQSAVAALLMAAGADINIQNKFGVTVLMIAVAEGNEALVSKLLDRQADAGRRSEGGQTALDIAVAKGNVKIVELLKHERKTH